MRSNIFCSDTNELVIVMGVFGNFISDRPRPVSVLVVNKKIFINNFVKNSIKFGVEKRVY